MRKSPWFLLAWGLMIGLASPSQAQTSGVSPNVLILPQGPGSLGGVGENVQPNLNMGLMSYQIKILVPKGRGDATPDPGIAYSSSAGSGIVGIGWSFSAGSAIERGTVQGLPKYENSDQFYAGGELVKIPTTSYYRARYEGGFARYRWVQKNTSDQRGYWIAEYPNGSKGYFGANAKGEIDLNAQVYGTQGTFRWELVTLVDRNGNRVEYSYFKDGPMAYPDQIRWVFDTSDNALYSLQFLYEPRPDFISDGKPGFDLQTKKRLAEIKITSAGKRFRSYKMTFEDASGLSRLIKVVRYGRDESKAYPIQFAMKYSDAVFSKENSRMVTMPTSLGVDFRSGNIDFLDINGDGLPDVVDTSKPKHVFHINQLQLKADMSQGSHDFPRGLAVENPQETSAKLSNASVQMLDINGDGFTDMVDAVNMKIYINKGNTKWEDGSLALRSFPVDGKDPNMRFMDYNGDKKIDVISSDGSATTFWVADGKGNWTVTPGKVNIGLGFSKDKLRLIDINGDGLQDIVHITKSSLRYRKYLGYGNWSDWIDVKINGLDKYELNTNAQFNDVNGDGMADMVAFLGNKIVYFVNKNGNEFKDGVELQAFEGIDLPDATKATIRIADINGNGSRDIVWIDSSGKVTYLELFGKRPNLMTEISNGIGQRINVEYGSSVYYYLRDKACKVGTDKACSGPWQNKMPMAFTVVTKITTWASRSDAPAAQKAPTSDERPQIQSIFYHDGFYDGTEKKFRGFRHVETLYDGDPAMGARKDELRYDVGDKDPYMHGRQLENTTSDGAGKLFRQILFAWGDCDVEVASGQDATKLTPPVRFICLTSRTTKMIEGRSQETRTMREQYTYDRFGNQIQRLREGDVDKDGDEQLRKTTYITPSDAGDTNAPWLLRFPQKLEQCDDKAGKRCADVHYFYDGESYKGLPAGELRKGNVSRVQTRIALGQDDFAETGSKYDKYGNLVGSRDAEGHLRTYKWDDVYHRFPVEETIQLKGRTLTMQTAWDYAQSKVVRSTDVNGLQTRYTYDLFGRLTEQYLPGDQDGLPGLRYSYDLKAPLSRIITESKTDDKQEYTQRGIRCFDGLGRNVSRLIKFEGDQYIVKGHKEFTRENQVARKLSSYYQKDDRCRFALPSDGVKTDYFYDGLRRLSRIELPQGAVVRREYLPLQIRIFDEEDNRKDSPHVDTPTTLILDGLGRVVEKRTMPQKGKEIVQRFAYSQLFADGSPRILKITFPDSSEKIHEYDLRGNVTKVLDPDRSSRSFTYDKNSQRLSTTDARGIVQRYTYDALGRLLTQMIEGKPETRTSFTYDVAPSGVDGLTFLKGRLASISYPGGRYLYSYNRRGMPIDAIHELMGVRFSIKRTYNNNNLPLRETFPHGQSIDYQYDGAGRLVEIKGKITAITYDQRARLASWKAANGIVTRWRYDDRDRLVSQQVADGKVYTLDYTRDHSSNILQWKQSHGDVSFTNAYTYDGLYRLTKADLVDGKESLTFQQDDLHNITSKISSLATKSAVHIGAYGYDSTKIHAVVSAGARKLAYDKAGLTSKSGALAFRWDGFGRKVETSKGDATIERSWYDHSSRRIVKAEGGEHVFYIAPQLELREGAFVSYVKLQHDRLVATWSAKGIANFFDDVGGGKADGQINAGDAIVYAATRRGDAKAQLKQRPLDIDLTKDMLNGSLQRMLLSDDGNDVYYHVDHLGSVRAVTDGEGHVIKRIHYYPYGKIRAQSGQMGLFSHGYQGSELDKASQTNAFLLRSLDPTLGKWLSPDPVFHQIQGLQDEDNSYGAVMNNPIRMRDIQGGSSQTESTIIGSVIAGVVLGVTAAAGAKVYKIHRDMKSSGEPAAAIKSTEKVSHLGDVSVLSKGATAPRRDTPKAADAAPAKQTKTPKPAKSPARPRLSQLSAAQFQTEIKSIQLGLESAGYGSFERTSSPKDAISTAKPSISMSKTKVRRRGSRSKKRLRSRPKKAK